MARIIARPLDRARPLWECYLIHGLPGGRVAVMTKIHHAVIDGLSGAEIVGALLDLAPEGRELSPPAPGPPPRRGPPGDLELLARRFLGIPRYPVRALRALPKALPNLEEVPHRRFVFTPLSLDEVKDIKNRHAVTVNDVIVSTCAGAVRRWLIKHEELPEEPLVAQIPVSVRREEQYGSYGNRILLMTAPLYTNIYDAVARLEQTHEALAEMKERHKALPAELLKDANEFIPPALFSRAARLTFSISASKRARPAWNLVVSSVPGPQFPLYMAGARLEAHYPISVVTDGMGLNITVMSYCGRLNFGIVADREQLPDLWALTEWLREALIELKAPPAPRVGLLAPL